MAFQQNETVSITVKIEGDEARNKLALLEKESRALEKAIKEVPKGSAEWQALNKEINQNQAAQQKLRSELGRFVCSKSRPAQSSPLPPLYYLSDIACQ